MADTISTPRNHTNGGSITITQAQKQALMDNLQLEITERARKLRAQYALQAQGLRSRLEMRVNRIPQSLRKRNIQELQDELAVKSKPAPAPPVPVASTALQSTTTTSTAARKSLKRNSDQISIGDDKENEELQSQQDLANPKKRTKTAAPTANTKAARTTKPTSAAVLSPRSQNSQVQPLRSPVKPAPVPEKSVLPKASSPVKSMAKAAVKAIGRAGTRKRAPEPTAKARTSQGSDTSNGTTVVSRAGVKKPTAASKKAAAPKTTTTATKKAAPVKKEAAPPATRTAGGRTLRNRG